MPNEIIDKYTSVVHRIKMICFIDTHIVILFHFIYTYCIWDNRFPQKGYSTSVNVSIETIVRSFCARRDPLLSFDASHRIAASSFPFLSLFWLRCLESLHRTAHGPQRLCIQIITISFRIQRFSVVERESPKKKKKNTADKIR